MLVEKNLPEMFGARFVATEFSTGAKHSGRIDTLALDENDNPMIIEYKAIESSDLVNQSLFYLSWLDDHRGEFELSARKKLGDKIEFDWTKIRVICIAPGFKKYDMHAVGMMDANIELWQFRLHDGNILGIEKLSTVSACAHCFAWCNSGISTIDIFISRCELFISSCDMITSRNKTPISICEFMTSTSEMSLF
jgi:hypothetical protein